MLCRLRFVLCAVALATTGATIPGCTFLDDFGEFQTAPADAGGSDADGGNGDGATVDGDGSVDAGPLTDGGDMDGAAGDRCQGVDCHDLDGPCAKGVCAAGACVASPRNEGDDCASDDLCVEDAVCTDGLCQGTPKDCRSFDSDCTQGMCDPTDGTCSATKAHHGDPCFDDDPCSVDEVCMAGECVGVAKDCSGLDDPQGCNVGTCNTVSGLCEDTPAGLNATCDDANPCTIGDACSVAGLCAGAGYALATATCDDYNTCTDGDHCDGTGECVAGTTIITGIACNDDNDCTTDTTCQGDGSCGAGSNTADGTPCAIACRSSDTCQGGVCSPPVVGTGTSEWNPICQFNWCNLAECDASYDGDGACDCGCSFTDADCNECSKWMCDRRFCDDSGAAVDNCHDTLMNDGKCDCGCQFEDPDCGGGSCCSATGVAGCADPDIEDCVCGNYTSGDPFCCGNDPGHTGTWDDLCAALAVQLGCATCN